MSALRSKKPRYELALGSFVLMLLAAGVLLLLPNALKRLVNFGAPVILNDVRATDYVSFLVSFSALLAIVLGVPVVVFALIRLRVVSRARLAKQRRYVALGSLVLGVFIARTLDPLSWILVASALYLSYEVGMLLGGLGDRRVSRGPEG